LKVQTLLTLCSITHSVEQNLFCFSICKTLQCELIDFCVTSCVAPTGSIMQRVGLEAKMQMQKVY